MSQAKVNNLTFNMIKCKTIKNTPLSNERQKNSFISSTYKEVGIGLYSVVANYSDKVTVKNTL